MNLFGRSKKAAVPNNDETVAKVQGMMELLEKKIAHLERKIRKEKTDAMEFKKAGNKGAALDCLRRVKVLDKDLKADQAKHGNLKEQLRVLNDAKFDAEYKTVLKGLTDAVKQQLDTLSIDDVDETNDQMEDNIAKAREIREALSRPVDNPELDMFDDDELWEELESMEKETQKAEPVEVARQTTEERMFEALPSAPTTAVKPGRQTTEDELAALEKEMGMAGMAG